ncbi:hypothetical protein OG2516_01751 [Oceanicola granulosus HTCC2516]|uniref:Phosphoadenosine phosphosulfate reductase n=1 Tax=Oceanicola granulosus (strain ATCC BAA-861 / DSM 15982 / KCTC 12143 / HTCC2516) TaxID=314256 RepID=Q2CFT9_OCEGH|nr:hypothetical protein [Oceanicola granulosus]EAR51603.1 hypothetical protein OG2516_01751 [Oceanicola granulosus HTCC2516]
MVEHAQTPTADLSDLTDEDWFAAVRAAGSERGFHVTLGASHDAVLLRAGPKLLVSFEVAARVQDLPDAEPRGWLHVREDGWSSLTVLSRGETWFRDPAVYDFFDRLTDEGVFDEFDDVLFFGVGSGGYAAAAYSVAAPGAQVVALRPQATLAADTAGWDPRYRRHRMACFDDRYGYAPDMADAARQVTVLFDPEETEDAMHAALFRRPHALRLPCPMLGWQIDRNLEGMDILAPLLRMAMAGRLDRAAFARLYQARRAHPPYLRALLGHLEDNGREGLAHRIARHGVKTTGRPVFRRRLARYEPDDGATAAE